MKINERIQRVVNEIYEGNRAKFAKSIHEPATSIANILGERQSLPSAKLLSSIVNSIECINPEWLLTGKGNMYKQQQEVIEQETSPFPAKPHIHTTYGLCGRPNGFSVAVQESDCNLLSLPFIKEYDFSIRAKGDSMLNRKDPSKSICEGDIVVCRIWKSRSHIRWGELYALSTTEGIVVKKVLPSERSGFIQCVSHNGEDGYMPYDLPVAEINDWALVIGVVRVSCWA